MSVKSIPSRRALLAAASLAAMSAATAHAQTASTPAPPYLSVDANGIDMVTGNFNFSFVEASIGSGPGAIEFDRIWGDGWRDNWSGGLVTSGSGTSTVYNVQLGPVSDTFTKSGTTFVSLQATGSTLTSTSTGYVYTASDGTAITYQSMDAQGFPIKSLSCGTAAACSVPTSIKKPDGTTFTMGWTEYLYCSKYSPDRECITGTAYYRWSGVSSSAGYRLTMAYQTNSPGSGSAPVPGWTYRTGVSLNNSLAPLSPGPSASYTLTGAEVTGVTDSLGRTWQFAYTNGNAYSIKRPGASGYSTVLAITGTNSFTLTRDGVTTSYSRVVSGSTATTTITDALSHVTTVVADLGKGQVTSVTDPLTHQTQYGYDSSNRLTSITYPEGNKVTYGLDARGNVQTTTTISKTPGTPANIVTSAVYPTACTYALTCNKPTSITDARGNVTSYTYDPAHGGVLTVTQPTVGGVAPQTRWTYTQIGSNGAPSSTGTYVVTQVSACRTTASCTGTNDETRKTVAYTTNMLPQTITTAAGDNSLSAATGLVFDGQGNPYTVTDPLGHVTRYRYDLDRELVGVVGPDPDGVGALKNRAQRITYNADGLVTLTEQGTVPSQSDTDWASFATLQQVATIYDANDRKTTDSAQAGGTTYAVNQYGYDSLGRLDCSAQRMNAVTFASLPASACTLAATGSYGPDRISRNSYDAASQLLKVTTGYGVTTANGFPATLQRDEETVTYSNNGKVKTLADARNNLTTYVYDGFDRLSQTQYPSPTTPGTSNTADYEQLGYDPAGNVTGRRLRGSTLAAGSYDIGYGYDALNRLSSKTLPSPEHGVTYAYDNLGQPKTITGATTLSYAFDALGRETSETQAYGSVAYQYDLANRRTRLTWQDGTWLTYDYDAADEMAHIYENGTTALASFNYDDLGQRVKRTLATGSITTYGYDPISRLTSLAITGGTNTNTTTLSNYSPAGEIGSRSNSNDAYAWTAGVNVNRPYTVNGLNQFATVAGAAQGYDGRGNLTSSGGTTYAYTSENLLKTVSGGFTLAYDPIGRLQEYDVPTATRFVYDGGMISEEVNSSGTVLRRYAFGPAGDEPIVWYEGSGTGTKRYIDQDERGSVTRITDASGAIVAVNSYDEYGIPGSANQGRFGYTGQAWLPEIGLAYYKARTYSPTLGRFMQTDPIGYADGPNWYNYVHSDPINGIDPWGLDDLSLPPFPVNGRCSGVGLTNVNGRCILTTSLQPGAPRQSAPKPPILTAPPPQNEIVVTARKPNVDCGSTLPNGMTVQYYVGTAIANINSTPDDPAGARKLAAFIKTVNSRGLIDFKNNFKGQADATFLAAAGNFAYGAIASGIGYSQGFAEFGAGAYAIKNGKGNPANPSFEDNSAAQNLPAGYATGGCSR